MPPIFGLHCLSEQFIYLKHKFLSYNFIRPTQDSLRDDDKFGSHTGPADTLNVLDEPHFFSRSTPPSTSPIDETPQSCKRKALLVGVEYNNDKERPLKGPHKDVRDMRQFLIGEFESTSKKYFERLSATSLADRRHYNPDNITLMINTDDPDAVHPTRKNIV